MRVFSSVNRVLPGHGFILDFVELFNALFGNEFFQTLGWDSNQTILDGFHVPKAVEFGLFAQFHCCFFDSCCCWWRCTIAGVALSPVRTANCWASTTPIKWIFTWSRIFLDVIVAFWRTNRRVLLLWLQSQLFSSGLWGSPSCRCCHWRTGTFFRSVTATTWPSGCRIANGNARRWQVCRRGTNISRLGGHHRHLSAFIISCKIQCWTVLVSRRSKSDLSMANNWSH